MVRELSSANREIPSIRGAVKYTLGNQQGAIVDFDRAIELNPRYSLAYYNRGITKSAVRNEQGAISDLSQAAELILIEGKMEYYQTAMSFLERTKK